MSSQFNENQFVFKAWMEQDGPGSTIKLHVHGHIEVADETLLYQLDKRVEQGYFPEELFLVIKPDPTPGKSKVALKYHEDLADAKTYKKVTILSQTEQLFEIKEIGFKEP